jgi:hypothetical protein
MTVVPDEDILASEGTMMTIVVLVVGGASAWKSLLNLMSDLHP